MVRRAVDRGMEGISVGGGMARHAGVYIVNVNSPFLFICILPVCATKKKTRVEM